MDINRIKTKILYRGNSAHDALIRFYEDTLPQFIQYQELIEKLEKLERDIDQLAIKRKQEFDSMVDMWEQKDNHDDVRTELSTMHEPDLTICVEAHDLAVHLADPTEIAPINPNDFVKSGRRDLILENTACSEIRDLT